MNRIQVFFKLLLTQNPHGSLQSACYLRPIRSLRYSRLDEGELVAVLMYCSCCDGRGKVYGSTCPRCEGDKVAMILNPKVLRGMHHDR